jgi:hypothetical protein
MVERQKEAMEVGAGKRQFTLKNQPLAFGP